MLSTTDALFIFVAAFCAGAMNSIAGGGTFLTLPALIVIGVPAKAANATSTVALWPGSVAGVIGYLPEIRGLRGRGILFIASLVGGLAGAVLLLATGEATFRQLIPWLMLLATILFSAGPSVMRRLRRGATKAGDASRVTLGTVLIQLVIALYGGYFGAGIGILMLAALSLAGMDDLHRMNGLKNGLATAINGIAVFTFIATDLLPAPEYFPWGDQDVLFWPHVLVMVAGSIAGGFAGVKLAKGLPTRVTRGIITTIGVVLTGWFFYVTYA